MIGSSQGGQPTAPIIRSTDYQPRYGQAQQKPQAQMPKAPFDTTYGHGSQAAWQNAGAPKSSIPRPTVGQAYPGIGQVTGSPGGINAQSTIRPPKYISNDATESSVNNILAQGYQNADQRFQMKQQDRAGFSRGRGNQYVAGQMSTQEMGKAASEAAQTRAQDQMQNAQMKSDYERAREMEAQSLALSEHGFQQADWNRWFAQQQAAAQLMQALMSGAQGMFGQYMS